MFYLVVCLTGGTAFISGPSGGEGGGEEEAGGGHRQNRTVGGGFDWSHTKGPSKGNRAR